MTASSATCRRCGASFTPDPAVVARYPGWTPPDCPTCFRASRGSRGGGAKAAGGGRRPRSRAGEGQRTLAEVASGPAAGPDDGLFTDGACVPNPGPGGWGAVYVVDGEVVAEDRGHEPGRTTNNRMELTALLRGIELVPADTPTVVWSDSNLAVRTVTEWAAGWARNGWKRKKGPVENLDLVQPLYEAFQARPELDLRWIKAHVGHRWNEYADALATAWTREQV